MKLLLILLIAAMAYGAGFFGFLRHLPQAEPTELPSASYGVVFTGSAKRIETGFDLMQRVWQGDLLITSLYKDTTVAQIDGYQLLTPQQQRRIQVDYTAQNTRDNARVAKAWLADKNISEVVLITAYYHLPRSKVLLQQQLPHIKIDTWPVVAGSPPKYSYLWREYNKLIATYLRLL